MKIFPRGLALLRGFFLSGLFTIIPLALTFFFISLTYGFMYKILAPLRSLNLGFLSLIPGSEFLLATLLIVALGVILRSFITSIVVDYFEKTINRIPLVRVVYSAAKMLVEFFKMSDKSPISRRVVLIQYPRAGNYHLAFLLESAEESYEKIVPNEWKSEPNERYVKVFMPNSPNPATGYFFILPQKEIVHTDITFEEAMKALVSCGLITPESLKKLPADYQAGKNYTNPSSR